MKRTLSLTVVCLLVLAVGTGVSVAQLEYAGTHPFALATATTTRLFGMGGITSCIPDRGFANPAFAGQLTSWSKVERGATTDFDSGLTLKGVQTSVAMPLHRNVDGLQVTAFNLRSNLFVAPGPVVYKLAENDVAIHYGRRISGPLLVGLAVSPVYHNSFNAIPVALMRSSANYGVRVGAAYELKGRGWLGATYDRYDEDVHILTLGPALNFTAHAEEITGGASYQLTDHWLAALEWQQLSTEAGALRFSNAGWRGGIEGRFQDMCVRLGSNQGSMSLGLGWQWRRFTFNYAYIGDWNRDILGPTFGSSTTNSLEVTCAF